MKNYMSSIIVKYGDRENVPQDCRTIYEILSRQGASLLTDCIAEQAGANANKFKMNAEERETLIKNLTEELENALRERL